MPPKKKSAIPDRWTEYKALGKRIPGTRFVAFKVPLRPGLQSLLPPSEAFGLMDLLQLLKEDSEELGLIIDLTFTTRYYQPEDLPSSVQYLKIYTKGHVVPNDKVILQFKKTVTSFLEGNSTNDRLIGVHCTHGLNRTGYLICRYLIDVEGLDPSKAVELFNTSRGHSIERDNYLQDLYHGPQRSNQCMEESGKEPVWGMAAQKGDFVTRAPPPLYHSSVLIQERPHQDCLRRVPGNKKRKKKKKAVQQCSGGPAMWAPQPPLLPLPPPPLLHHPPVWRQPLPPSHSGQQRGGLYGGPMPFSTLPCYTWPGPAGPCPPDLEQYVGRAQGPQSTGWHKGPRRDWC